MHAARNTGEGGAQRPFRKPVCALGGIQIVIRGLYGLHPCKGELLSQGRRPTAPGSAEASRITGPPGALPTSSPPPSSHSSTTPAQCGSGRHRRAAEHLPEQQSWLIQQTSEIMRQSCQPSALGLREAEAFEGAEESNSSLEVCPSWAVSTSKAASSSSGGAGDSVTLLRAVMFGASMLTAKVRGAGFPGTVMVLASTGVGRSAAAGAKPDSEAFPTAESFALPRLLPKNSLAPARTSRDRSSSDAAFQHIIASRRVAVWAAQEAHAC